MWKKIFLCVTLFALFFYSQIQVGAQALKAVTVEVYDVRNKKSVRRVPSTEDIQGEVRAFITSIKGISPSIKIEPPSGVIYKIPVEPPVMYNGQWFSFLIDELFLIVSPTEKPRILLFDDENKVHVMVFEHDIKRFVLLVDGK